MARTNPPHPEERSRERVSKDAERQPRDDFPLIAKQDVCMPKRFRGDDEAEHRLETIMP